MSKVRECKACGQGFNEYDEEVGGRLSIINCLNGHVGPFERIPPAGCSWLEWASGWGAIFHYDQMKQVKVVDIDSIKIFTKTFKELQKTLVGVKDVLEEVVDRDGYDSISASSSIREIRKDAYESKYGVVVADLQCMITGKSLNSIAASVSTTPSSSIINLVHLIPRCANATEQSKLGFVQEDIENIRNTVILCEGLEEAFDRKLISFVPSEKPFAPNKYKLHIWCASVRSQPIYEGSTEKIEDFDGFPLNLTVGEHSHDPYKRAMSYQAFRASQKWAKINDHLKELPENSDMSVYEGSYKSIREKYALQLTKDIEDEVDED